jgi:hypothetical protein
MNPQFVEIPANKLSICGRKPLYGKGINDSTYKLVYISEGKKVRCPVYVRWNAMLTRVFCPKNRVLQPTYEGATVSEDWLRFSNFYDFYKKNCLDGWELDKDIKIKGNLHYSPETCLYVPSEVNKFLLSPRKNGRLPRGVVARRKEGRFAAYVRINSIKKYLGDFGSPEEAHTAYVIAKNKNIDCLYDKWKGYEFSQYLKQHKLEVPH